MFNDKAYVGNLSNTEGGGGREKKKSKETQARNSLPFRASRCSCFGGFTSILTGTSDQWLTLASEGN